MGGDIQKICTLLTDVGIFGSGVMQCYEAHIPPLLQFLQDYNLYGMNWMHVSALMWRRPLPPAVCSDDDGDHDDMAYYDSDTNRDEHYDDDSDNNMYIKVTEATASN